MKFTSKELAKAMNLKIGDKIKLNKRNYTISEHNENIVIETLNDYYQLTYLIGKDYEILPKPKRVGDLLCDDFEGCDYGCPLEWLCCNHCCTEHDIDISLYDVLDYYKINDQEIYDLLKARLDKVVE